MAKVNRVALLIVFALMGTAAQARTCAVEVEDLQAIKLRAVELAMQNVSIDSGKAKSAERQVRRALEGGGPISIDMNELKGAVRMKGTPSKAALRDLVARVQKIIETCKL
jgi:hypothetical protein